MGMLADWFVQIRTEGADVAKKDIDDTKKGLDKGEKSAGMFGGAIGKLFKMLGPIALLMKVISTAMQSEEGEALAETFGRIAEILARLITPLLGVAASFLDRMAPLLEKVVGVLSVIIDFNARLLDTFLLVGQTIVEYLLLPLQAVLDLITEVTGISFEFKPMKKGTGGKEAKSVSFEDPADVFKRIQESIAGGNLQKQSLDCLKDIRTYSAGIETELKRAKPAVA